MDSRSGRARAGTCSARWTPSPTRSRVLAHRPERLRYMSAGRRACTETRPAAQIELRRQVLARVQRLDLDARIREAARIIGPDDRRHGQIRRRVLVLDGHGVQGTPLAFGPMRRLLLCVAAGCDARLRLSGARPGRLHRRLLRDPTGAAASARRVVVQPRRNPVADCPRPGIVASEPSVGEHGAGRASTPPSPRRRGARIIGYRLWRSVSAAAELELHALPSAAVGTRGASSKRCWTIARLQRRSATRRHRRATTSRSRRRHPRASSPTSTATRATVRAAAGRRHCQPPRRSI